MGIIIIIIGLFRATPQHSEVPRQGVELELQLPVYTSATATPVPSHVYYLHYSSWQCQMLNPPSKAGDWTCVLIDTTWVHCHWATTGTPFFFFFFLINGCGVLSNAFYVSIEMIFICDFFQFCCNWFLVSYCCVQKRCLIWFQSLKLLRLVLWPDKINPGKMFHVYLRRKCILLLLDGMFSMCIC